MVNGAIKIYKDKKTLKNEEISLIENLISNLKYGFITLKIQDGILIQIDKNEKIRLK